MSGAGALLALDEAIDFWPEAYRLDELEEARAAFAEMIEIARSVASELDGPDGVSGATADRLNASIARVDGAAA